MSIGRRVLCLLMFLRLLAPPGICLCKLSAPAVAYLSGNPAPDSEQSSEDDDHAPGCPCSPLASAMGLRAPIETVPAPALALDEIVCLTATAAECRLFALPSVPAWDFHPTLVDDGRLLLI